MLPRRPCVGETVNLYVSHVVPVQGNWQRDCKF